MAALAAMAVDAGPARSRTRPAHATAHVSVFATGFNNPRGLTFGPDGNLYVAEGGLGGSHIDRRQVRAGRRRRGAVHRQHEQPKLGGRISKVTPAGVRRRSSTRCRPARRARRSAAW